VVPRRLVVLALLALTSVLGVADQAASTPRPTPGPAAIVPSLARVRFGQAGPTSVLSYAVRPDDAAARAGQDGLAHGTDLSATDDRAGLSALTGQAGLAEVVDRADQSQPCFVRADCAGGALLAGAAILLFLPAPTLSLPSPGPGAGALTRPAGLRSALLARKHFRPPRPS
jgi:hypothetical protein